MKKFASFLKNKKLIALLIIVLILVNVVAWIVPTPASNSTKTTIVIDAGHGGRDGGSVGKSGTLEKEINLKYSLALKSKLENAGYNVVLTRKTDQGLYDETAPNKKISDMQARMQIIKQANPALVVSIHMNSFPLSSARGANTYFKENDPASEMCANYIQRALSAYCESPNKLARPADYYIVKCSYYTSVLVECGFISNPEEEAKLNTEEYMQKIVYSIFAGVQLYLGNTSFAV